MAREIKFRAWDGRRFLYDHFFVRHSIVFKDADPHGVDMSGKRTVYGTDWKLQQFTGLYDKNKKEIYEGDVVSDGHSNNFIIKWFEDECQFGAEYILEPEFEYQGIGDWCEVVGNIYESVHQLAP